MKATGIVVEYNPLHNGHLYHIRETRKQSNCDVLIAVMSGHFVQRGEPAVLNKQIRAKQALKSGVDLIVELPFYYSVQSADYFALGAIKILDALHVDDLYFGSETGNIDELHKVSDQLNSVELEKHIETSIKQGKSYPQAINNALSTTINFNLVNPNDILGIRYIKAIRELNASIKPATFRRLNANYHDEELNESNIASATSIRNKLFSVDEKESIKHVVPPYVYQDLTTQRLISWDDLYPFLKYKIITSQKNLLEIHGVNQEIYSRLQNFIHSSNKFNPFIQAMTTKRLTKSRIKRALCNILLDVKKQQIQDEDLKSGPNYIRILGINKTGKNYIKKIKKEIKLPLITNIKKEHYTLIEFDEKVSDFYHYIDQNKKRNIPIIF